MKENSATIRELRIDFRSVKRRIEEHGEVVITDRGAPAYVIKAIAQKKHITAPAPDYYARLLKRQPKAISLEEARAFWDGERR